MTRLRWLLAERFCKTPGRWGETPYRKRRLISIQSIGLTDTWLCGQLRPDRRAGASMLDGVSLDQLRTFIAAVDEGSFSAASRKLLRSQSVISEAVGNLEDQIGVALFDRSGRYPKLTPAGTI